MAAEESLAACNGWRACASLAAAVATHLPMCCTAITRLAVALHAGGGVGAVVAVRGAPAGRRGRREGAV